MIAPPLHPLEIWRTTPPERPTNLDKQGH